MSIYWKMYTRKEFNIKNRQAIRACNFSSIQWKIEPQQKKELSEKSNQCNLITKSDSIQKFNLLIKWILRRAFDNVLWHVKSLCMMAYRTKSIRHKSISREWCVVHCPVNIFQVTQIIWLKIQRTRDGKSPKERVCRAFVCICRVWNAQQKIIWLNFIELKIWIWKDDHFHLRNSFTFDGQINFANIWNQFYLLSDEEKYFLLFF